MHFLPFLEWKLRLLFWTLVKQNKSAIASKTNHLFYWPVLFFFSCPWEKWCWRSLWGSDHGAGGEKGSANHAHPSPLPAVPLNAAISRTGQINQDSLPSALNCTSSLNCTHTDTHTSTLMPPISEMLQLLDDKVSPLAMSGSQLSFFPSVSLSPSISALWCTPFEIAFGVFSKAVECSAGCKCQCSYCNWRCVSPYWRMWLSSTTQK